MRDHCRCTATRFLSATRPSSFGSLYAPTALSHSVLCRPLSSLDQVYCFSRSHVALRPCVKHAFYRVSMRNSKKTINLLLPHTVISASACILGGDPFPRITQKCPALEKRRFVPLHFINKNLNGHVFINRDRKQYNTDYCWHIRIHKEIFG